MICIMHEADPYGHLVIAGKALSPSALARLVREKEHLVARMLGELRDAGVYETVGKTIVSKRMVRDEQIRKARATGGRLGGNPALLKVIR